MPQYNHPQKQMNWFLKKFENSDNIHALKTISRIVGIFALFITFLLSHNPLYSLTAFALGILMTDALFFFNGMEESKYKTEKSFKRLATTAESMNTYNDLLMISKAAFFIISFFFENGIFYYGIFCFFIPLCIARIAQYKPWIGDRTKINPSFEDRCGYNSSQTSSTDMMYGVAGYDIAGVYTGSPTAIGGVSS